MKTSPSTRVKSLLHVLLANVLPVHFLLAQDILLYKTGVELKTKNLRVNVDHVTFKKFDNPEGPTYTVRKSELFMVKHPNGTNEVFGNSEPIGTTVQKTQEEKKPAAPIVTNKKPSAAPTYYTNPTRPSSAYSKPKKEAASPKMVPSTYSPKRSIGTNLFLFGKVKGGYLEYEKMITPSLSLSCRFTVLGYTKEIDYDNYGSSHTSGPYVETGGGVGPGISTRWYTSKSRQLKGFYIGTGLDVLSIHYTWTTNYTYSSGYTKYKQEGAGENSFLLVSFTQEIGYKFTIGKYFYLDPAIVLGPYFTTNDDPDAKTVGGFFIPSIKLGTRF
jgi:hypothetical protein